MASKGENKLEEVTHAVQEVLQNAKQLASKAERRVHNATDKVRDKLNGRS